MKKHVTRVAMRFYSLSTLPSPQLCVWGEERKGETEHRDAEWPHVQGKEELSQHGMAPRTKRIPLPALPQPSL